MAAPGAFKKKEVDIEALMAQAAALEEEEKRAAAGQKKKEKPPKVKKVKPPKAKKVKPEKKKKVKKPKQGARKVFGIPLAEVEIDEDEEMPLVWVNLITVLESHACDTKGLFRVTASLAAIDELIDRYESGEDIDWNEIDDKHIVGGVLMAFLLRLPEPLIPFSIYDKLIEISMSGEDKEWKLYHYKPILQQLPILNRAMLEILADFLDTLTRDADDNMMTADNLAICFAPGLMRREVEELTQLMKESPFVNEVVSAIIDQYGFLFRGEEIDKFEDDEEDEPDPDSAANLLHFEVFTQKSLCSITKRLQQIENNLEWPKLWSKEALSKLSVAAQLLDMLLKGQLKGITNEIIQEQLKLYSAPFETLDGGCKTMRGKINKIYMLFEDQKVLLNEKKGNQKILLFLCKLSKHVTALLAWLVPEIELKQCDTESFDKNQAGAFVEQAKGQLKQVKKNLDNCEEHQEAVMISRIIRAVQKALKDRIKSPLSEIDFVVPAAGTSSKRKIEMVQDSLEFSFPLCDKLLKSTLEQVNGPDISDMDAMLCVDLLGEITKTLSKYLGTETAAPPAQISYSTTSPSTGFIRAKPSRSLPNDSPTAPGHRNRKIFMNTRK